ncbi:calcium-binding protein [Roseibium sp. AS2]|uniref:calcium-binding protein n=1 Tax=Roseibium sp. AS2 TaxID=3135781 RepID=UPI003173BA3D
MSYFRGRLFGFEANHIIPKEAISGTSLQALAARDLLNDINFNVEARANKMMLFISDAARDAVLAAPDAVQNVFKDAGFGFNTHDSNKGSHAAYNSFVLQTLSEIQNASILNGWESADKEHAVFDFLNFLRDTNADGVPPIFGTSTDTFQSAWQFWGGSKDYDNLTQGQIDSINAFKTSLGPDGLTPIGEGSQHNSKYRYEQFQKLINEAEGVLSPDQIDKAEKLFSRAVANGDYSGHASAAGISILADLQKLSSIPVDANAAIKEYLAAHIYRFIADKEGSVSVGVASGAALLEQTLTLVDDIFGTIGSYADDFADALNSLGDSVIGEMAKSVDALLVGIGGGIVGDTVEFLNLAYDAIKFGFQTGDWTDLGEAIAQYGAAAIASALLVTGSVVAVTALVGVVSASAAPIVGAFVAAGWAAYGIYDAFENGVELFGKITTDLAEVLPIAFDAAHELGDNIAENIALAKEVIDVAFGDGFQPAEFANANGGLATKYLIDGNDPTLPDQIDGTDTAEARRFYGQNNATIDAGDGNDEIFIQGVGTAIGGEGNDLLVGGHGREVNAGAAIDPHNPDSKIADADLKLRLDGGAGDDMIVATGHAEIEGGAGEDWIFHTGEGTIDAGADDDFIYFNNPSDPQNPLTYGEEREQMTIDTGTGDDWILGLGAADIRLGAGNDWLISAGIGSTIDLGFGGSEDRDTVNMMYSRGTLLTSADGYDKVYMYGFWDLAGSYVKHRDSESDFFYGMGGLLKLGLNSNGELVAGDILSDNNNQESFLYIANFNNDPLANPLDLTAGVRLGEIETEMWRTIEGRDSGIGSATGASLWEFLVAVVKDIHFRANAGGVDPLVFDLDGDGLELTAMVTGVSPMFDMDGDGFAEHTGWVAPDDGLLAIDLNGNGLIDDINELFGGPGLSGFDALAAFDMNADGVIDANDAVFGNLRMWRDLDRDAITDEGELFTLADLDIASIDLSPEDDGSQNALNVVARTGTFTRGDGCVGAVGDVEFRVNNYDTVYIGDTTIDAGVAATMPELKGHGTLADLQVSVTLDGVDGPLAQTISSVLPTLNVVDLNVLSERAFAILSAWADAVPTSQVFGDNPDVPVLIDRSGGGLEVVDFALQVTEDVTIEDDTVVSVTYWKRAGGTPIKDSDGNVIEYPSFEQILAHDTNDGDAAWEVVTSEELGFIERYFGEDIPIEREEALSGSGISGLGDLLGRTELLVEQLALRLAMQGGLSDYFDGVGYSVETDRFAPTTEFELIPFFKKIFEDAPADAAGAQAWLDAWKPLIDTLLSDYDRPGSGRITEPFLFTNVVAAYESVGLPIGLADAANSLGVSPDLVDYGTGERTGTSGNEIFYMSSGDDVIESKSGGDVFVFGENFGHDVINDYEQSVDGFDTIRFAHLTPDDVVATREGKDLVITVVETGDTIRVTGQFHDIGYTLSGGMVGPYQGIEEIVFANGDVWGQGEIATAVAHPEDTDDTIVGTDHGDVLDGGAGDDLLQGGNGFDIYRFDTGYGQDIIQDLQMNVLSPAEDLVLFGEGLNREDLSFYRDGDSDDLVINTSGGDSLTIKGQFNGGSALGMEIWIGRIEYFQFTNGDPESQGFDHADIMRTLVSQGKTDDDDVIYGFTFDDVLDGGAGDDFLSGGDKNDTYVFGFGYGSDVFDEGNLDLNFETIDKVLLGAGITQDDLTLERDGGSSDLVVKLTDGSQFTIKKQFLGDSIAGNHYFAIETIEFADGSFWDQEYIYNTLLEHTVGDDELYGFWRDDVMDGGAGDDYLNGGDGDDTYLFGLGYGQDVIHDGFVSVFSNENDRLLFGEGIAKDDVVWSRDGASNDLIVTLADGSIATLQGQFSYNNFGHRYFDIELFEFADGQTMTIWDIQNLLLQATDGDDVLYGFASEDEFDGGAGNDVYYGGEYSDNYHFGYGYGHDRILDEQVSLFIDNTDRIVFGDGVTASDVTVSWADDRYLDLKLSLGTDDSITIEQYRAGSSSFYVVEEFHFQDGSVWQTADLFAKYLQATVTNGDDIVAGFAIDDVIDAGDGNDTIYGQNGNDILIGGLGDDTLDGGKGADTYRYALGDGHDWIIESYGNGTSDTLEFAAGITASDISLSRSQEDVEDILLTFSDGGTILLEQQFSIVASSGIEYFQFADGTVWTSESLAGQLANNAWTDGDDTIQGFSGQDDFLYAGGGNDTVYGYSGTDTIIGGLGDDTLDGGSSSDIYHYNLGDGADTIIENYSNGSADKLILGESILASEVSATRGASDLDEATLSFSDGGSILLKYQFRNITQSGVELIEFSDGTVWNHAALQASYFANFNLEESNTIYGFGDAAGDVIDAGAENDTVYGYGGADTIRGGLGNDYLDGGESSDTYLYDLGDGNDTIIENYSNGSADKLMLGSGILANEVIVTRGSSDLDEATLSFSDGGSILLKYQFRNITQSGVELIEFADGMVWNHAALQASYFANFNLEESNTIYGFGDAAGDVIDAGAENDTVYGYGGADTIRGGLGNDYLDGGKSSDTYLYDLGDGNDTIFENYSSGSADKLLLGDGIHVDEIQVVRSTQDFNDITLLFKNGGSVFLDQELWNISYAGVETIQFADGTVWNKSDLKTRSLIGGDGDDSIVGFGTDDFVDGGNGADTLTGGDGTDTFHFSFGGTGHDVITDFLAGAGSEDVLEFETGIFTDMAAVVASVSDDGTDTTIAIDDDTSITLQNVLVSQLHQDDFQLL